MAPKGIERHGFVRKLFALSRTVTPALFIQSLERAHTYRITNLETIERIVVLCMGQAQTELPSVDIDEDFRQRPTYQEGHLTDPPDLSVYKDMLEKNDE